MENRYRTDDTMDDNMDDNLISVTELANELPLEIPLKLVVDTNKSKRGRVVRSKDNVKDVKAYQDIVSGYRCALCDSIVDIEFHKANGWDAKGDIVSDTFYEYGKKRAIDELGESTPLCKSCHTKWHKVNPQQCKYQAKCCPLYNTEDCKTIKCNQAEETQT